MAPARAGPLTSSSVLHPYRRTTFSASFAAHVSNPVALPAEGTSACFTALAHPAVEQTPAADGGCTEPAPDGVHRLVQGLPLLALPAVEQLALHSHPPGEPGRADAQEPQGQQVAADAAVEEGQFQLREQLAGKTVVGVLSGGNLDLPELARTLAGAGD
jgi:hypothetical protein